MQNISSHKIKTFQKKIFQWWEANQRDLPWRKTTNPYFILVSEVMLQQTQVSRTIPKYLEFIDKFPTFNSLAKATPAAILKVWSGMGYNRRALWLQEAAQQLNELDSFPTKPEELQKLKGIGPYSSRSILIFAFNQNISTVDTNIRRIMIAEGFASEESTEKELFILAEKLIPIGRSRDWHNALMDYGSLVLTVAKTGIKPITTQKKYDKSSRFFRGKIVKELTQNESMTKMELAKKCEIEKQVVEKLLLGLMKDGLVQKENRRYRLP